MALRTANEKRDFVAASLVHATQHRRTRGGTAGRIYPGNFDWEKLKNAQTNKAQLARKIHGAPEWKRVRNDRRKSPSAGTKSSVHGSNAARVTGK